MSHPFFDVIEYPWARDDAGRFHDQLHRAIPDPERIELLCKKCTLEIQLTKSQTPELIWKTALEQLTVRKVLRRFCDLLLNDNGLAAIHPVVQSILDASADHDAATIPLPEKLSLVKNYCQYHFQRWKEATDRSRTKEEHQKDDDEFKKLRLDCYVEPDYAIHDTDRPEDLQEMASREAAAQGGYNELQTSGYKRVEGGIEEFVAKYLIGDEASHAPWLCIAEDAGAGKTVFSYRLRALFCDPEVSKRLSPTSGYAKPWLVVRIEHWPTPPNYLGVEEVLRRQLASVVGKRPKDVTEVIEYALEHQRVVLIVDALDQQPDKVIEILNGLRTDDILRAQVRLVVTSRIYKVAEHRSLKHLFDDQRWRYGCVELFDNKQQQEYFQDLDEDTYKARQRLMPDPDVVSDLLRLPDVLRMIRELLEERSDDIPLRPFRQRGDLYYRVAERLLRRAFMRPDIPVRDADIELLLEALSVYAIEMMLDENHRRDYTVRDRLNDFKEKAAERYSRGQTRRARRWEWLEANEFLTNTLLTDRCILERNDDQMLGFRSRKWLDFMAGLHLARFASEKSSRQAGPFANDPDWIWVWRFAIELATVPLVRNEPAPFNGSVLCKSLSSVFARPLNGRRPTELIFRAWHLFEVDPLVLHQLPFVDSPGDPLVDDKARVKLIDVGKKLILPNAAAVIARFRQEFQDSLVDDQVGKGFQRQGAAIARELLDSFSRCPPINWRYPDEPDRDPCIFWMGLPKGTGNVEGIPQHQVRVRPFDMQMTLVSREQYRLFDLQHDQTNDFLAQLIHKYCQKEGSATPERSRVR